MFGTATVYAHHFQLHVQRPLEKLRCWPGMTHQEAKFLVVDATLRLFVNHIRPIPGIFVIAGIDDQNIAFVTDLTR